MNDHVKSTSRVPSFFVAKGSNCFSSPLHILVEISAQAFYSSIAFLCTRLIPSLLTASFININDGLQCRRFHRVREWF